MTVGTIISRNNYTGNGAVDTYNYSYRIFLQGDLTVIVTDLDGVDTTLTITTDYTVTGVGELAGGTVVLASSAQAWLDVDGDLKSGYGLAIIRVLDLTQETDIRNQGDFFPEVHEDEFDKLTMIDQQQQDAIERSIRLPASVDPADFDTALPASIVGQDSVTIMTNPAGDAFIVGPTADQISGATASAVAAAASAVSSAASASSSSSSASASAVSAAAALVSQNAAAVSAAAALASEVAAAASEASFGTQLSDHITDATDAHDASAISNVAAGNLAATNQQSVNNELQGDIDTINTSLATKVTGVASAVDGEIALFDLTTGKLVKRATGTGFVKATSGVYSTSAAVSLTADVSGILPVANGGTNSSTALSGSSIVVSNGTNIVQGAAGTATTLLHGNASGAPTYSAVSLTADVTGVLPLANGGSNKNMTAVNGGVVWTDADSMEVSAAGTSGQVLQSNGAAAPTWVTPTGQLKIATITDQKAGGNQGGGFTSGSFATRVLNTLVDTYSIVTSLASNQFVLPAGTYFFDCSAPAYSVDNHQTKLRNITDSTDALTGTSEACINGATVSQTISRTTGTVVIAGSKTFELQHRCTTTKATNGLGVSAGFSINETYAVVNIYKVA